MGREVGEVVFEGVEESGHFGGGGSAFVCGEESGVGLILIAPEFCLLAGDVDELFEMRSEGGKVVFVACFGPSGFGEGGGLGVFLDESLGDAGGSVVAMAEFSEVCGLFGERFVFRSSESFLVWDAGAEFMNLAREEGELVGPVSNSSFGEVGLLVPTDGGGGSAVEVFFAKELGELFKSRHAKESLKEQES